MLKNLFAMHKGLRRLKIMYDSAVKYGRKKEAEEISQRIDLLCWDYSIKRHKVAENIGKLDNECHQELLRYRYLDFKTWDEIADIMYYDRRYIYKLHRAALEAYNKKYPAL